MASTLNAKKYANTKIILKYILAGHIITKNYIYSAESKNKNKKNKIRRIFIQKITYLFLSMKIKGKHVPENFDSIIEYYSIDLLIFPATMEKGFR